MNHVWVPVEELVVALEQKYKNEPGCSGVAAGAAEATLIKYSLGRLRCGRAFRKAGPRQ
jgi:hypothetical protein